LFNNYKNEIRYNKNRAYSLLNKEYKEKRFNDFNKFQEYLSERVRETVISQLDKYTILKYNDYTEYVCVDKNNNYYIFQETSPMKYTVLLDTYTVDLPEFLEKYNDGDEEVKVRMNINRFFEAIKLGDYEYAYSKLDETFKESYFKTLAEFETYTKNTFAYELIQYEEFEDLEGVYTYLIGIENGENTLERTCTVNLLEGTDYTISFDI